MEPFYLTTAEAAESLGYTVQHVRRLVREGKLEGRKLGRDWLLDAESINRHSARKEFLNLPLEPSPSQEADDR